MLDSSCFCQWLLKTEETDINSLNYIVMLIVSLPICLRLTLPPFFSTFNIYRLAGITDFIGNTNKIWLKVWFFFSHAIHLCMASGVFFYKHFWTERLVKISCLRSYKNVQCKETRHNFFPTPHWPLLYFHTQPVLYLQKAGGIWTTFRKPRQGTTLQFGGGPNKRHGGCQSKFSNQNSNSSLCPSAIWYWARDACNCQYWHSATTREAMYKVFQVLLLPWTIINCPLTINRIMCIL